MNKTLVLNKKNLDNFELLNKEYLVETKYYDNPSGEQEYKLYSYITTLFNDITILDIGTHLGTSAVSLSHNENNKVISFDIKNHINNFNHKIYEKKNIEFILDNVLNYLNEDTIKKIKIILIDINHVGYQETLILRKLISLKFSGIVILDDIHHPNKLINIQMRKLWNNIKLPKFDLTKYGHSSGTGLLLINYDLNIIEE